MDKLRKVRATIDYIEAHLTQNPDLDEIAGAVYYSRYYLHRIFSKTVGLTIHEYLQRRRLTEAAKLLVFSDKSILDIALLAGYESQQAFTACFSAMYKQTPNQYRKNEKFYPLQLRFKFDGSYDMLNCKDPCQWSVDRAAEEDIPRWMELVRLVVDGFPHLDEEEYIGALRRRIAAGQGLIIKDGGTAVGILLFSPSSGSIDFMGAHPLYWRKGIPGAFLDKVMELLGGGTQVSITTYREGDKADTGHRREIIGLGFAEAELLEEFGYPTQRFVLVRDETCDFPADQGD